MFSRGKGGIFLVKRKFSCWTHGVYRLFTGRNGTRKFPLNPLRASALYNMAVGVSFIWMVRLPVGRPLWSVVMLESCQLFTTYFAKALLERVNTGAHTKE